MSLIILPKEKKLFSVNPGGSVVKNLPANAWVAGSIPRSGRFPGEGNGNPSSILAWEIPCTEEPGGLLSMGSKRVGHSLVTERHRQHLTQASALLEHWGLSWGSSWGGGGQNISRKHIPWCNRYFHRNSVPRNTDPKSLPQKLGTSHTHYDDWF